MTLRTVLFSLSLFVGIVILTALCQGQTLRSLSISASQPAVTIGGSTQLTARANFSNGSSSNVSGVRWSSADARIVSVSGDGLAAGNATGRVSITASYRGKTASLTVASSIGAIHWSGPVTITRGGTYSGNWRSTNPGVPAVTIATSAPVVIQNSHVMGPNDLISDPPYANNLTVRNVIGIGVNPNVRGQGAGIFVNAQNPALLDVQNCYFENVQFGVWVRGYAGKRDGIETITITKNRGRNILGTESDGNNGTLPGESHWQWAHAFQLGNVRAVPGIQIAWNEIVNYPYRSLVNENVNLFDSSGTVNSPIQFHDNYIQGAYAYNPAVDAFNGGGFATDGTSGDTVQNSSSFIEIYNNQIVDTVGIGIADIYGNTANGSMYGNDMHDNTVGWMCWAARCAWDGYRADEYFQYSGGDYSENHSISANPITLRMQANEYTAWMAKLIYSRVDVGPDR